MIYSHKNNKIGMGMPNMTASDSQGHIRFITTQNVPKQQLLTHHTVLLTSDVHFEGQFTLNIRICSLFQ